MHIATFALGLLAISGTAQAEGKNKPEDLIKVNLPDEMKFRLDLASHYGVGLAVSFRTGLQKHFSLAPVGVGNIFLGGAARVAEQREAVAMGAGLWFGLTSPRPGMEGEEIGNTLGGYLVVHELAAEGERFTSTRSVRIGLGRRRSALSDFTYVLGDDEELVRQWTLHISSTIPVAEDFFITQFSDVAIGNPTAPAMITQGLAVGSEL
jgi:hypothetical protein